MEAIINSIKNYFSKKDKGEETGSSPELTCPVCWGHSEWDGQYYEIKKDKHNVPGGDVYDSFISKVVDEHVRTTHNLENKYICTTCDKAIN